MSKTGRDRNDRQPDLFDFHASPPDASRAAPPERIDPASLGDSDLCANFAKASVTTVEALGEEIVRRRPDGWQRASLALWDRHLGFGRTSPMLEQVVVLNLVQRTREADLLRQLLSRGQLAECVEAQLLRAAVACRIALRGDVVLRGLSHPHADIRCAAARLAVISGLPTAQLQPYLADSAREVRRATATVLAEAGETLARDTLLFEMRAQPDRAGLEALSFVANEDVVIRLGQIARQHPAWREIIVEILLTIDHPRADCVVASLSN